MNLINNNFQNLTASQETIIRHYLPNDKDIKYLSNFYYAFSDETRLKIIISLCINPLCVGDLANILKINQSTISHQLQILKNLQIVDCKRNKKTIIYSIINDSVEKVIECGVDSKSYFNI